MAEKEKQRSAVQEVAELRNLNTAQLREKYQGVIGEPTVSRNTTWLRKRIGYALQRQINGGLPPVVEKREKEVIANPKVEPDEDGPKTHRPSAKPKKAKQRDPRLPKPGTILKREFKGKTVECKVFEEGFEYHGKTFSSLSKVAKEATGSTWNGFLFFGLVK